MLIGEFTTAFATEAITVGNTAGGVRLTLATLSPNGAPPAIRALITNETGEIRFTYDGTAPTTLVGHLLAIGGTLVLEGMDNLVKFRAIRTGATSGKLTATYER